MPCVLWVSCDCPSGEIVDIVEIQPYKIIEKGSVVDTKAGERYYNHTVCGFDVSTADFTDFKKQVTDATKWLQQYFPQLSRLESLGATAKLDFGFYTQFADSKIVAQYDTIPYQLAQLTGTLKIDIELSQYWYAEGQGAQLN